MFSVWRQAAGSRVVYGIGLLSSRGFGGQGEKNYRPRLRFFRRGRGSSRQSAEVAGVAEDAMAAKAFSIAAVGLQAAEPCHGGAVFRKTLARVVLLHPKIPDGFGRLGERRSRPRPRRKDCSRAWSVGPEAVANDVLDVDSGHAGGLGAMMGGTACRSQASAATLCGQIVTADVLDLDIAAGYIDIAWFCTGVKVAGDVQIALQGFIGTVQGPKQSILPRFFCTTGRPVAGQP